MCKITIKELYYSKYTKSDLQTDWIQEQRGSLNPTNTYYTLLTDGATCIFVGICILAWLYIPFSNPESTLDSLFLREPNGFVNGLNNTGNIH